MQDQATHLGTDPPPVTARAPILLVHPLSHFQESSPFLFIPDLPYSTIGEKSLIVLDRLHQSGATSLLAARLTSVGFVVEPVEDS